MLLILQTTADPNWITAARSWLAARPELETAVGIVGLLAVAWLANFVARRYLVRLVERLTAKSAIDWDNVVAHHGVFRRLAHLIPLAIVYFGINVVPNVPPTVYDTIENIVLVLMVWTVMRSADGLLNAVGQIYDGLPMAKDRPIRGFLQLFKIFMYVMGAILIVAVAIGQSPLVLLGGFGAMTAVLMLVFKDTILSVVASYDLGRGWEVGGRFRLVSGNPTTPIEGAVYDAGLDVYRPIYGRTNSGPRSPGFGSSTANPGGTSAA